MLDARRMSWCFVTLAASMLLAGVAQAQRAPSSGAQTTRWVQDRVLAARRGDAELVQIGLAHASSGWGCDCPSEYVGDDPHTGEGPWLLLRVEPDVELPEVGARGAAWTVEGYFTGAVARYVSDDPGAGRYLQYEFVLTRLVRRRAANDVRVVRSRYASCVHRVEDTTPLRVRARPGARADVVAELPTETALTIDEVRPEWLRISAPAVGWVWAANVGASCTVIEDPRASER